MSKDKVTNIDKTPNDFVKEKAEEEGNKKAQKREDASGPGMDPDRMYTTTWKDQVAAIGNIGDTLYKPAGMILALRKVEVSLLEVIKEINVEINKQQAIIDAKSPKHKEADNG